MVRPLIFDSNIRQACLPEPSFNPNSEAFVSGWGHANLFFQPIEKFGAIKLKTLQYVSIPLLSYEDCVSMFPPGHIAPGMFCAGRPKEGSCNGDSGKIHTTLLF